MVNAIKKYKFTLYAIFLTLINFLLILKISNSEIANGNKSILKIITILLVIFQVIIFLILNYVKKKEFKIENIFLIFALIYGFLYMFLLPIWSVPDELNHFYRAYEISEGKLISLKKDNEVGNYFSDNITDAFVKDVYDIKYSETIRASKVKYHKQKDYYNFANTALYSFVCYIPQSLGILIGKILHLPIIWTAYLGRLFNFLTWLTLIYLSIKCTPIGKKLIFAIAFMPMSMQEAISLSPDALINSVSIVFASFVLYHMYNKKKLEKKDYIISILLSISISMLKIVYLPLCLLLFLIPYDKFKSKKDKYIKIGIIALIVIIFNLIWLKISSNFLIEFNPGVNSSEQVKFILTRPYSYIIVLFNTIEANFMTYLFTLLGSNLEWLNVLVSQAYLFIYLMLILYIAHFEKDKQIKIETKYILCFVSLCIVILIFTSLYVQWTPLKNPEILGVQGRYFIPLLLPFLLLLKNDKIKKDIENINYIYYFIFSLNIYVLFLIFYTHIF